MFGIAVQAQPNLNSANNAPAVGQTYIYYGTSWQDPGTSGAAVLWEYNTIGSSATITLDYISPAAPANAATFAGAGATVASDDGLGHIFYFKNTPSGFSQVGDDTLPASIPYADGKTLLAFPCTYGTTWDDSFSASYTAGGNPAVRSGHITGNADGYGTLTMPYAVIDNVLRVHTVDSTNDLVAGILSISNVIDRYSWYKTWLPVPLLITQTKALSTGGGAPVITSYTQWLDGDVVGIAEHSRDAFGAQLFPNPANDEVTLTFGIDQTTSMTMDVIDALGRTIKHDQLGTLALGFQQHTFDAHSLSAGLYTVRLHDALGHASNVQLMVQ